MRVMIFWDFSNFQITLENLMKKDLGEVRDFDHVAFARALQGRDDLVKIYFACSAGYNDGELAGFYKTIDYSPYFYVKVFERAVDPQSGRNSEKQLDVYIATQMVALAYENAYDVAYLISGDEDYVPAMEIVHQKGKVVVAVSAQSAMSKLLKRKADKFILIDDSQVEKNKAYYYRNFLKE